jgi:hypothetical protein
MDEMNKYSILFHLASPLQRAKDDTPKSPTCTGYLPPQKSPVISHCLTYASVLIMVLLTAIGLHLF